MGEFSIRTPFQERRFSRTAHYVVDRRVFWIRVADESKKSRRCVSINAKGVV